MSTSIRRTMHRQGHLSGVYGSLASVVPDLLGMPERGPDEIWFANWDDAPAAADPAIAASAWAYHQRIKQYRGPHDETHGGVTLNVDSDALDTVLRLAPAPSSPSPSPGRSPTRRPSPSPRPGPSR